MKNFNSLSQKFVLIFVLVFCSVQLFAQDKITLKWQVSDVTNPKSLSCYAEGDFMVNWGDGNIETLPSYSALLSHTYTATGEKEVVITASNTNCKVARVDCRKEQVTELSFLNCPYLAKLLCSDNMITNLNLSGYVHLFDLECEDNLLTHLDLSGCIGLVDLYCENNQISNLNVSGCNSLESLYCENNQIKLTNLYAIQLVTTNYNGNHFGTQNLPTTSAKLNTVFFEDQSVINGIFTEYSVSLDGSPAPESNYTVKDGKLIFLEEGKYTVTMTNDAIFAYEYDPAQVIVPVEVVPVGITENSILQIEVYPNPTTGKLKIENGELKIENVEIFDIYGKNLTPHTSYLSPHTSLDISNFPAGIYFIKIQTSVGEVVKKVVKQ